MSLFEFLKQVGHDIEAVFPIIGTPTGYETATGVLFERKRWIIYRCSSQLVVSKWDNSLMRPLGKPGYILTDRESIIHYCNSPVLLRARQYITLLNDHYPPTKIRSPGACPGGKCGMCQLWCTIR